MQANIDRSLRCIGLPKGCYTRKMKRGLLYRTLILDTILPEIRGREFLSDNSSASTNHCLTDAKYSGSTVIPRQTNNKHTDCRHSHRHGNINSIVFSYSKRITSAYDGKVVSEVLDYCRFC